MPAFNMFAAVKDGQPPECLNRTAAKVREEMGSYYAKGHAPTKEEDRQGWQKARRDGWRVRRVRVEVL